MTDTNNADTPATGECTRELVAVFMCEPGRKPFATVADAQSAIDGAVESGHYEGVVWHTQASDGGFFAVGMKSNG